DNASYSVGTALQFYYLPGNGESKTRTLSVVGDILSKLREAAEDGTQLVFGNAHSRILYTKNYDNRILCIFYQMRRNLYKSFIGEFDGIAKQVENNLVKA